MRNMEPWRVLGIVGVMLYSYIQLQAQSMLLFYIASLRAGLAAFMSAPKLQAHPTVFRRGHNIVMLSTPAEPAVMRWLTKWRIHVRLHRLATNPQE